MQKRKEELKQLTVRIPKDLLIAVERKLREETVIEGRKGRKTLREIIENYLIEYVRDRIK